MINWNNKEPVGTWSALFAVDSDGNIADSFETSVVDDITISFKGQNMTSTEENEPLGAIGNAIQSIFGLPTSTISGVSRRVTQELDI